MNSHKRLHGKTIEVVAYESFENSLIILWVVVATQAKVLDTEMALNFYKYHAALYKIFINEPLAQCAVSLTCWFIYE